MRHRAFFLGASSVIGKNRFPSPRLGRVVGQLQTFKAVRQPHVRTATSREEERQLGLFRRGFEGCSKEAEASAFCPRSSFSGRANVEAVVEAANSSPLRRRKEMPALGASRGTLRGG